MKIGVNIGDLTAAKALLLNFMALDPRGGIFMQQHMHKAIAESLDKGTVAVLASEEGKSVGEILGLLAYKCRVMCAHTRQVRDTCTGTPHPLDDVFDLMKPGLAESAKRQRRAARVRPREHPFICFRRGEGEVGQSTEEDEAIVVTKYFDGVFARLLLSDG
eukprot:8867627-Lingulodinium_polyedra.AAC.1